MATESDSDGSCTSCSELNLSCESSDYDCNSQCNSGNVSARPLPYQFEPDASEFEEESVAEGDDHDDLGLGRLFSSQWCSCGECEAMGAIRECRCCHEIPEMTRLLNEAGVQCITSHPGFKSVCLDKYVLETCYTWYNQQYRRTIQEGNNRYRYVSYRMLARFAWGWLGKDIRVTLPACAVMQIRKAYPSPDGVYTGYLEAGS